MQSEESVQLTNNAQTHWPFGIVLEMWCNVLDLRGSSENDGRTRFSPEPSTQQTSRSLGELEMKRLAITILTVVFTMGISSTAFAGNIAGGRATGNIAGGRAAGNIAGGRSSTVRNPYVVISAPTNGTSRLDPDSTFSGAFAGLIRILLETGALL